MANARRKFAEIIKASRKGQALTPAQEAASEAIRLVDMIYHRDNSFKESYTEERLTNRQQTVAPQVDAYFAWVKQTRNKICGSQKLTEALNYSFNQEPYLRVFLQDALIPLDNNDAERERSLCQCPSIQYCGKCKGKPTKALRILCIPTKGTPQISKRKCS